MIQLYISPKAMKDSEVVEVVGSKMGRKENATAWVIPASAPITGLLFFVRYRHAWWQLNGAVVY